AVIACYWHFLPYFPQRAPPLTHLLIKNGSKGELLMKRILHTIRHLLQVSTFALVLLAGSTLAFAQQPLGSLSGVVTDPSGAVVAGATETATLLATGTTCTATTHVHGLCVIPT